MEKIIRFLFRLFGLYPYLIKVKYIDRYGHIQEFSTIQYFKNLYEATRYGKILDQEYTKEGLTVVYIEATLLAKKEVDDEEI